MGVTPRDVDAAFAPGYLAAGADFDTHADTSSGGDGGDVGDGGSGTVGKDDVEKKEEHEKEAEEDTRVYVPTLPSWAAKPVAVLLSSFEEVVALDADVIPLAGSELKRHVVQSHARIESCIDALH